MIFPLVRKGIHPSVALALTHAVIYGPDPARHIAAITQAAEAGYTHVWVHQIGPDQAGFFQFYAREVLPKFHKSWSAS
jgi:hypothetical protein